MKLALIALVVVGVAGGCRSWCHDEDSRDRNRMTATQDPYRSGTSGTAHNNSGFDRDTNRDSTTWQGNRDFDTSRNVATQDQDTTDTIRRRISDASLSQNARNTVIMTQNGYVTLRGPLDSQTEKETVARIARDIAGDGRVYDLTDVVQAR